MLHLLSHYNITVINLINYEFHEIFDAFENNDSIWKTNKNESIIQVKDNYLNEKNNLKNVDFVNKKMNLKIFEFLKKKTIMTKTKWILTTMMMTMKKKSKNDREIIKISNDE